LKLWSDIIKQIVKEV